MGGGGVKEEKEKKDSVALHHFRRLTGVLCYSSWFGEGQTSCALFSHFSSQTQPAGDKSTDTEEDQDHFTLCSGKRPLNSGRK